VPVDAERTSRIPNSSALRDFWVDAIRSEALSEARVAKLDRLCPSNDQLMAHQKTSIRVKGGGVDKMSRRQGFDRRYATMKSCAIPEAGKTITPAELTMTFPSQALELRRQGSKGDDGVIGEEKHLQSPASRYLPWHSRRIDQPPAGSIRPLHQAISLPPKGALNSKHGQPEDRERREQQNETRYNDKEHCLSHGIHLYQWDHTAPLRCNSQAPV
jgi:hypothetical protein